MTNQLKLAVLRLARKNSMFREALVAELRKTSKLMARQEAILKKYLETVGLSRAAMVFDELPGNIQVALRRVKDQETLHSDVDRWLGDNNNPHMRSAALKTAHKPIMLREGLTPDKVRSGEAFMVYNIDKGTNKSKFYEALISSTGSGYVLLLAWGRLTDSGQTGRIDRKSEMYSDLATAKRALMGHYRKRLAHGYVDAFGPHHVDPATGRKLKLGEYPVGLGAAGFGWGGQGMSACVPSLRNLRKYIADAMMEFRMPQDRFQILADLDMVNREIGEIPDSTMAAKLRKYMDAAKKMINAAKDEADVAKCKKALKTIDNYLAKQLALC